MAYLSMHWQNSSSEERWASMDGTWFPEGTLWLTCWWQVMSLPASLLPLSQELVTLDHSLRSVTDVHWPTFGLMNCIIYLHTVPQVLSVKGSGAPGSLSAPRAFLSCSGWQSAARVCQELPRGDIWNSALQLWPQHSTNDCYWRAIMMATLNSERFSFWFCFGVFWAFFGLFWEGW